MVIMSSNGRLRARNPRILQRASAKSVLWILVPILLISQGTHFFKSNNTNLQERRNSETSNDSNIPIPAEGIESKPARGKERKLEFVHITKTGGSAIEKAAALMDINWGSCHYMEFDEVGCMTPDLPYEAPEFQSYAQTSPWHTPPKLLYSYVDESHSPYVNSDLFAVIRNPYDRVVSEYYCPWMGFQAKYNKSINHDKNPHDPVNLNWWVKDMVTRLEEQLNEFKSTKIEDRPKEQRKGLNEDERLLAQKHYINQAEYVFDGDVQIIMNIVHYENLQTEFDALMERYGLDLKLPSKKESGVYASEASESGRLTYRDLDPEAIAIVNRYARADFDRFGYKMVQVFTTGIDYDLTASIR